MYKFKYIYKNLSKSKFSYLHTNKIEFPKLFDYFSSIILVSKYVKYLNKF